MNNTEHQLINFEPNSSFDNDTDPVTKIPFAVGESLIVCRDKNSLISKRSLEANENLCPLCNRILDSSLKIIGSAPSEGGKKPATYDPPPAPPQPRSSGTAPLLWAGLALVALVCFVLAAAGVWTALGGSGSGSSSPEPVYYEQPTSAPIQPPVQQTEPRSTNPPPDTALPEPTWTAEAQNRGTAEVSDQIYFAALRKSAGYVGKNDQTDVIVEVPSGSTVTLLDGPKKADGINWWYVEWNGQKGWMAERTGSGKTILIF